MFSLPYIDRDFIKSFFGTFIGLMIFLQVAIFVSVLLDKYPYIFSASDSKVLWVLYYYLLSIPRQAAYTIPICTAIAVLWMYSNKAKTNELLAFLVGGVSPLRLARPMLLASFVLFGVAFLTIELVANQADREAERIDRVNIMGRDPESLGRDRNVFQKGQESRFYNIRSFVAARGTMEHPTIVQVSEDWRTITWRLDARSAEWDNSKGRWIFHHATFRRFGPDGSVQEFVQRTALSEDEIGGLEEELSRYLRQRQRPGQMRMGELLDTIKLFELQGRPTHELRAHLHFNVAIPLGAFVLACLMIGHILRPSSAGMVVGLGGGLVYIAVYYGTLVFFRQAAMAGAISPLIAAYAPNLCFFALGLFLLSRNRAL